MVEAVNQSALVVFAESIEVTKVWDRERIERLETWYAEQGDEWAGMCITQRVAAAITLELGGDIADARRWDIVPFTNLGEDGDITPFTFEIPAGARAIRFLDGNDGTGELIPFNDFLVNIGWANATAEVFAGTPGPQVVVYQDRVPTDSCALDVPPNATHIVLAYETTAMEENLALPFIIEWVIMPGYK
jgi:hypothetical protein